MDRLNPAPPPVGGQLSHGQTLRGQCDMNAWQAARRVLAVRLDNMGDVLMTTPALRALRQSTPGRHITLLAGSAGKALQPHLEDADEVLQARPPWLPGGTLLPDELLALAETLRQEHFDAAVIFTVYSQSALPAALLCWLAHIPLRLAYSRENPYHLLSDWIIDPEPHEVLRHEVRRQLDLVEAVGARTEDTHLSFHIRDDDRTRADTLLRSAGIDPAQPYIVVHPGASAPSRRYPPELYAAVLEHLGEPADEDGLQIVFTGSTDESETIRDVRRQTSTGSATLAGVLDLGGLAAVIDGAALLIANNTGPVHIASALGTPVVDVYALTNPQHAPWQVEHRVLYEDVPCRWCYRSVCPQHHHACLRLLDPARVAAAARELLDGGADSARTSATPTADGH